MRSDEEIRRDVEAELKWEPGIDSRDIGVAVKEGIVALTGSVRSYAERWDAEKATKRIPGVIGIANDITVVLPQSQRVPDPEIAHAAALALRMHLAGAAGGIQPVVSDGCITLEGEVAWNHQRQGAETAVRRLKGVLAIDNRIRVRPSEAPDAAEIKRKIEEAFRRHAEIDAKAVVVTIKGETVTLGGIVESWAERDEAERVVWAAPGITEVVNRIAVAT
jgi:osmotically-inducible protein OsmY